MPFRQELEEDRLDRLDGVTSTGWISGLMGAAFWLFVLAMLVSWVWRGMRRYWEDEKARMRAHGEERRSRGLCGRYNFLDRHCELPADHEGKHRAL